jgi:hypothetical protein
MSVTSTGSEPWRLPVIEMAGSTSATSNVRAPSVSSDTIWRLSSDMACQSKPTETFAMAASNPPTSNPTWPKLLVVSPATPPEQSQFASAAIPGNASAPSPGCTVIVQWGSVDIDTTMSRATPSTVRCATSWMAVDDVGGLVPVMSRTTTSMPVTSSFPEMIVQVAAGSVTVKL